MLYYGNTSMQYTNILAIYQCNMVIYWFDMAIYQCNNVIYWFNMVIYQCNVNILM